MKLAHGLRTVAEFIGDQLFRQEVGSSGQDIGRRAWREQLSIQPRGCPDGPGKSSPEGVPLPQFQAEPRARLHFHTGVVVVFELCPYFESQAFTDERDLVLNKAGKPFPPNGGREKREARTVRDV